MSNEQSEPLGLQVLRSIRRILRQVQRYSRVVGTETGLGVPQLLCLRAIAEGAGEAEVTVAHVADAVQLSRSTTSTLVDRMVRQGLVTRERSDRDRRRVDLGLTDAGRRALDAVPVPLEARFLERLAALDPDEQARIVEVLAKVVDLMGAEDLDAAPMFAPNADVT